MKTLIIASTLFAVTAAAVTLFPTAPVGTGTDPLTNVTVVPGNEGPKVEVVFALDTTGSMSGLIDAAKEKIWSIASTMAAAQPSPEIRMGLVAYRDRSDEYVTRVVDLSSDLDSVYASLMDLRANGGGDGPESVNRALHDAINEISWSQNGQAYRVVFLVGDAPPHMDYQDEILYPQTLAQARQLGIVVNAVQCGAMAATTKDWKRIASLGAGRYLHVDQSGGAVAITTPFDEKLAHLSAKLDGTRLYFGSDEARQKQKRKLEAAKKLHASSSVESLARRADFNLTKSGEENFLGEGELVDAVTSGRVELSSINRDELPEPMQAMAPAEQEEVIVETAQRRNELKAQIRELTEERSSYLRQKVEELGGAKDSLDDKLYSAVREQAGKAGLRYEASAPAY